MDRRNISGPKRAQNAIRFLVAFLHTSTHIHARQSSPAWTVRVGFASPQLHMAVPSRGATLLPLDRRFNHTLSLRARLIEV